MKIVFLDAGSLGSDVDYSEFEQLGEVVKYPRTSPEEVPERIEDADVVVVNKVPVNESTISSARNLKLVCVSATGTNNLDKDYLDRRGIEWRNAAGYSTESVAQHTFAMLFYLMEGLRYYDDYVKNGFLRRIGELIAMFDYNAVREYLPGGVRNVLYGITNRVFRGGGIYRWWFGKVFPKLKKDDSMCSDINSFTFSHRYDFKREWLGKGKRVPFEGEMLPVSEQSDATLRVCYGDYMTLPPEEKRVSNHHPYYFSPDREYHPGMELSKGENHG